MYVCMYVRKLVSPDNMFDTCYVDLFAAGGSGQDLLDISAVWASNDKSTMFFI